MNTTVENNKLIAEFMGWKEQTDPTEKFFGSFKTADFIVHKNTSKEPLLFHDDWNWLMEVIEKIESLKTPITNNINLAGQFEDYEIHIQDKLVVIYAHGEVTKDVCYVKGTTKIEAVYNAVIQFIKWYNSAEEKL